jgi:hypothetical protein
MAGTETGPTSNGEATIMIPEGALPASMPSLADTTKLHIGRLHHLTISKSVVAEILTCCQSPGEVVLDQ